MGEIYSKPAPPLEFVRSKDLAIYSFFGIPAEDSSEFSKALLDFENDPGSTEDAVDFKGFIDKYCPQNSRLMKVIWLEYFSLLVKKMKPEAFEKAKNTEANPDLLIFTCFLLFFLTLEKSLLSDFTYWIYFGNDSKRGTKEAEVSPEKLKELVNLFGKSKVEKEKKLLKKRLEHMETSTKGLDPERFKRKQFHILDVKCNMPFSAPLFALQREIKASMLPKGTKVWKVMSKCVRSVNNDIELAKQRLVDKKEKRVEHHKETGDRKAARKGLAPFVKLYQDYLQSLTIEDEGSLGQGKSILTALFEIAFGSSKKVSPEVDAKVKDDSRRLGREDEREEAKRSDQETVVDTLDLQSMTHIYRKQLKFPVEKAFRDAADRKEVARQLIAECEDEVLSADQILKLYMPSSTGLVADSSSNLINEDAHFSDDEDNDGKIDGGNVSDINVIGGDVGNEGIM